MSKFYIDILHYCQEIEQKTGAASLALRALTVALKVTALADYSTSSAMVSLA